MRTNNYTVPFIVSMLQNKGTLSESRFYKADLTASDMLMDLDIIIEKADLTAKQLYILNHYWIDGYTQEIVAQSLGITQQMVEKHSKAIKKKIKKVLIDMGELEDGEK